LLSFNDSFNASLFEYSDAYLKVFEFSFKFFLKVSAHHKRSFCQPLQNSALLQRRYFGV